MTSPVQQLRRSNFVTTVCLSLIILFCFGAYYTLQSWDLPRLAQISYPLRLPNTYSRPRTHVKEQGDTWKTLHELLLTYAPQAELPHRRESSTHLEIVYNANGTRERPDLLLMSARAVGQMQARHAALVKELKTGNLGLTYIAGTKGLVTTANGQDLPFLVVSLRMLRRTGSTLPVEVFLANYEEYGADICDNVLPTLDATCVVSSDILDVSEVCPSIERLPLKIRSILFSSFEDVLFLEWNAFPVRNPDALFKSEPFTSNGMVIWPDFWFPSESSHYFQVAQVPQPLLNERAATAGGELLYSKASHGLSLMLAAYYNYYGPHYYYPLLSQGVFGGGDKETFPWAAEALEESFYDVKKGVCTIGHHASKSAFMGSATVQYDPVQDFNVSRRTSGLSNCEGSDLVNPMFVHANYDDFLLASLSVDSPMNARGPLREEIGMLPRVWHEEKESVELFGFDVERRLWEEIMWTACELEHKFTTWQGMQDVCSRVTSANDDL